MLQAPKAWRRVSAIFERAHFVVFLVKSPELSAAQAAFVHNRRIVAAATGFYNRSSPCN
jgi:hypothetical protein